MKSNVRYQAWEMGFGLRNTLSGLFNSLLPVLQKQVFIAVVLISSAIGFRYYILDNDSQMHAIASSVKSGFDIDNRLDFSDAALSNGDRHENMSASANSSSADTRQSKKVKPVMLAQNDSGSRETAMEHAGKHADPTYVCPMHPTVVSKNPDATCPMCGMDLVLVETGGEAGVVSISPRVINMLGVRTSRVKKKTLYRRINSVGNIQFDENKISHIHLRTDGWVEELTVRALGDRVAQGDLLFRLYSPKLVNAQEELLQSLDIGNDPLTEASRERLRSLGMSENQIISLEQSGKVSRLVDYFAPHAGVVSALNVREGMFVKPSKSVVSLVDMSTIWLVANVFESHTDWVEVGNKARATMSFRPGKTWKGVVEHIYPSLDAKTRSLEVRMRFDNPDENLKANMFANVTIFAKPRKEALSIPRESIIRTGEGDRVIVAMGEGRFKPVVVQTGIESSDRIEILSGLTEGEQVVISSQFLIDSESSLKASLLRMSGG